MAVKVKCTAKKNPQTGDTKYYAQVAATQPVTLREIVRDIEKQSTVSSADIKAVLDALQYVIARHVSDGHSVRLGDLGSFRLTVTSIGTPAPGEVTAANIKRTRVQFAPGGALREMTRREAVNFYMDKDKEGGTAEAGE